MRYVVIYLIENKGWHSNIFCTPIFILSQDESQETTTEITYSQKAILFLSGWEPILPFSQTMIRITFIT